MSTTDVTYDGVEFGMQFDAGLGEIAVLGVIKDGRYRLVIEGDDDGLTANGPIEGPATALPLQLAGLAALGPRDAPAEDAPVLFVELLESSGREALAEAWDDELREGTALAGDDWLLWSAFVAWEANGETLVDGITVVDGAERGLAMVVESEAGLMVQPATPTEVWFALCGLLPRPWELRGDAPPIDTHPRPPAPRHPLRQLIRHLGAALAAATAVLVLAAAGQPAIAAADTLGQPPVAKLHWRSCRGGMACTTMSVPLNYAEPAGAHLRVALIRKQATRKRGRLGAIVLNPGGPGGSGLELLRSIADVDAMRRLNERHTLVSFDPRGIGASSPVSCGRRSASRLYAASPDHAPLTPAAFAPRIQRYIAECQAKSGSLLPFLGTADVARDMEGLRSSLGEPKLNYLGFSYGSFLGATYAALFPDSVGAMVLDGADDPDQYANRPLENDLAQAAANETEFGRFLSYAKGRSGLGRGTPAAAYGRLIARLAARPKHVTVDVGTKRVKIDPAAVSSVMGELIATHYLWPTLADATSDLIHGHPELFGELVSIIGGSDEGGDGETAAFFANSGIDRVGVPAGLDDAYVAAVRAATPSFPDDPWTSTQVDTLWPHSPARFAGPWTFPAAPGRTPILVIGTTFDPRTVYSGAVAMRAQLGNASLLTLDGDGHTAFAGYNGRCIDRAVERYFDTRQPPADGKRCAQPAA